MRATCVQGLSGFDLPIEREGGSKQQDGKDCNAEHTKQAWKVSHEFDEGKWALQTVREQVVWTAGH